ncbi:hypothetical protein DPMN_086695 [Dreissena polymorpha]|uniref:Uncharacterized protein n=1 Tax=Dreissena polymorpha TaxID=45954 RepID=A0A9D4KSC3_DREPO|nr:hypothetical protein DPMN_086695 [Dreissena polymorpha]
MPVFQKTCGVKITIAVVNSDGTLEILKATIDDDGMYACHVARATGQQIYRFPAASTRYAEWISPYHLCDV